MTPLEALRSDLADVPGWLRVREPGASTVERWVTVTRPPYWRDLVVVTLESASSTGEARLWEQEATDALPDSGYRAGVRWRDCVSIEGAPQAGNLSAHQRL